MKGNQKWWSSVQLVLSIPPPTFDLGSLAEYVKPIISNLGFKIDSNLKLDWHISAVAKSSFFHLRQLAKVKPLLARQQFKTAIQAFITPRPDSCNALYYAVSQASLARLPLVQNAAARLLTGARKREHITPIRASCPCILESILRFSYLFLKL